MTIPPTSVLPFRARNIPPSFQPTGSPDPAAFKVAFGQLTFDSEGAETFGRYFSRSAHWPGGASGITIGRGYDMGQRTKLQIARELLAAGVPQADATTLSAAAGLRGAQARRYMEQFGGSLPSITPEQQKRLFESITAFETISDIKRILAKPDLVALYGEARWEDLTPEMQELIFDLRYRGDYTPAVRARVQPYITAGDIVGLADVMSDSEFWREQNVPTDRIARRADYAQGAVMVLARQAYA